ncbi:MAG: hypothetical protein K0R61_4905 [Microvirga sp.]|nr:hypothetical protein [Microvirga sp.]
MGGLNASAVEVLRLWDGTRTLAEIADVSAARFARDRARIASETHGLLRDLAARRMVEP